MTVGAPSNRFANAAFSLLLTAAVGLSSCAAPRAVLVERGPQAHYQTAYPVHDVSRDLARIFLAVRQVMFTAEYRTYVFAEGSGVTEADVTAGRYRERADSSYTETLSKAGTATILARSADLLTLVTVEHVTRFPERRIQYWEDAPHGSTPTAPREVASVSVRTSLHGTLVPSTGPAPLEVTARDEPNDLALLRVSLGSLSDTARFQVLDVPGGDARQLSWGSFLYVVGYPKSTRMVTRGIVSSPDRDGRGGFITDGLWNEGMSGGLVLAVRGDNGDMELVGIARSAVGEREFRLRPDTLALGAESEVQRYDGPLFVQPSLRILYGITLPVPVNVVKEFLHRNGLTLRGPRPG